MRVSSKTLIDLLLCVGFTHPTSHIYIHREDIRKFKQRSVRKAIGVVPQDTSLFNDTLLNNLRYGSLSATFADVEKAVESAQLRPFIDAQPQGFNIAVGERGLKLSGGEKQRYVCKRERKTELFTHTHTKTHTHIHRVAIARCILKDAPILLLDESTSALDVSIPSMHASALSHFLHIRTPMPAQIFIYTYRRKLRRRSPMPSTVWAAIARCLSLPIASVRCEMRTRLSSWTRAGASMCVYVFNTTPKFSSIHSLH